MVTCLQDGDMFHCVIYMCLTYILHNIGDNDVRPVPRFGSIVLKLKNVMNYLLPVVTKLKKIQVVPHNSCDNMLLLSVVIVSNFVTMGGSFISIPPIPYYLW